MWYFTCLLKSRVYLEQKYKLKYFVLALTVWFALIGLFVVCSVGLSGLLHNRLIVIIWFNRCAHELQITYCQWSKWKLEMTCTFNFSFKLAFKLPNYMCCIYLYNLEYFSNLYNICVKKISRMISSYLLIDVFIVNKLLFNHVYKLSGSWASTYSADTPSVTGVLFLTQGALPIPFPSPPCDFLSDLYTVLSSKCMKWPKI